MYALVAISRKGKDSIILDCSADEDHIGAWEHEFDTVGSYDLNTIGITVPELNGIFMLECMSIYPVEYNQDDTLNNSDPNWKCVWRMATINEVKKFMRGQHIWKVEIGQRIKYESE